MRQLSVFLFNGNEYLVAVMCHLKADIKLHKMTYHMLK